ncbi:hypothetical protein [Brevundimonas sp.]|uniref:hypothetical protein n=1 Tax=Brevundimonas sp. TaxID=1871086 RepID=UPI003564CBD0
MARAERGGGGLAAGLTALTLVAPVLVGVAAFGTRTGAWSVGLGYDLLTRQVAFGLSFVGVAAALLLLVLALRGRRLLAYAAMAMVVAGATLGGFVWHGARVAAGPVEDVSTDLAEIPGFGPLRDRRGGPGPGPGATVGLDTCPGAISIPTQALPESVVYVLQNAGFAVERAGVAAVYGTRRGFWFGFSHDVAVRIRPGRTDVRVAARDARPQGGEACRLAAEISAALREAV